jgi:hypothetical protein
MEVITLLNPSMQLRLRLRVRKGLKRLSWYRIPIRLLSARATMARVKFSPSSTSDLS